MMTMSTSFAAVFAALYAAHLIADHWGQTDTQARRKTAPGWSGRLWCARHVMTHVAVTLATLTAVSTRAGLGGSPCRVTVGVALIAVTHYLADRRAPLARLAAALRCGEYWRNGGAYPLDQSWHVAWLYVAALVIT